MIGTIRKHSKWLWVVIITLTVISFIYWGAAPSQRGGGTAGGDYGSIAGKKITQQQYVQAFNDFKLFYFFNYGTFPGKKTDISEAEMERATYERLLLNQKTADLGIHVGLESAAAVASQMIRSLGRNGENVPLDAFAKQILEPEGLTVADFENFVRDNIAVQQLVQSVGSAGLLITPQEAAGIYQREHQEFTTQIVLLSANDYLADVAVTPEAVMRFYTNYLAAYRLPDRVQVNYVAFTLSNFLAQSKAEWARTNFDAQIDSIYLQEGAAAFPDAKTPADAKKEIHDILIRNRALVDARTQANEFAAAVFNLEPARVENLVTVAEQKGLTVGITAPFAAEAGPQDFAAPEAFTRAAFGLTPDEPFANPIVGTNAVYVIALARRLPSEIPPFADIRARVTQDFKQQQAVSLARAAGTNFFLKLKIYMATGKSFAAACVAAGQQPLVLPPFSLSTPELQELEGRVELKQLKQVAFTTAVGHMSDFQESDDGGFILFVQSQLPVDQAVMNADLPQFTESLRRERINEAFNEWLNVQVRQEFGSLKIFQRDAGN